MVCRSAVVVPAGAADVLQAVQADEREEVSSRPQDARTAGEHSPSQDCQLQVTSFFCFILITVLQIRDLFWPRDPGWVEKSGSGSGMNKPGSHFRELKKQFFGLKYLNSLINIPDPQHCLMCDFVPLWRPAVPYVPRTDMWQWWYIQNNFSRTGFYFSSVSDLDAIQFYPPPSNQLNSNQGPTRPNAETCIEIFSKVHE